MPKLWLVRHNLQADSDSVKRRGNDAHFEVCFLLEDLAELLACADWNTTRVRKFNFFIFLCLPTKKKNVQVPTLSSQNAQNRTNVCKVQVPNLRKNYSTKSNFFDSYFTPNFIKQPLIFFFLLLILKKKAIFN